MKILLPKRQQQRWFGIILWSWRSWFNPQMVLFVVVVSLNKELYLDCTNLPSCIIGECFSGCISLSKKLHSHCSSPPSCAYMGTWPWLEKVSWTHMKTYFTGKMYVQLSRVKLIILYLSLPNYWFSTHHKNYWRIQRRITSLIQLSSNIM